MGPKRPAPGVSGSVAKGKKSVMTLSKKVDKSNKVKEGMPYAAIGRLFGVNKSTGRSIKKKQTQDS